MGESIAHSQQVRGDGKVEPDVKATSVILAHTLSSAENLNLENPNLARDLSTLANLVCMYCKYESPFTMI